MITTRCAFLRCTLIPLLLGSVLGALTAAERPNILFFITDDQSGDHTGAAGAKGLNTPAFDRVAAEGVLFTNAFCATPSCTPSRSAVLTGQATYRLEEGGILLSKLPSKFPMFPGLLADAGYFVGHTGKTWSPGRLDEGWGGRHPVGIPYQKKKIPKKDRIKAASGTDYAANFADFLTDRPEGRPFLFWYGSSEPHLAYDEGRGLREGKKLEDAKLYAGWPEGDAFRSDVLDYYTEIEHADTHLGRMLAMLEEAGELDRTLVVCTSDHGIPLARAKASLYDAGTKVPLAVRFPERVPGGRVVTDFVSLTDLAPTFLELAGLEVPEDVTGRSLWNVLSSSAGGRVDHARDRTFFAFERHTWCRPGGVGYPMRGIRTDQFLYIRNYAPDRWPAGDPDFDAAPQGFCGDIDRAPSKTFLLGLRGDPDGNRAWELCIGKRPAEELYDVKADPDQVNNLAGDPSLADIKDQLASQLRHYLRRTGDPRVKGETPWDDYIYYGKVPEGEKTR